MKDHSATDSLESFKSFIKEQANPSWLQIREFASERFLMANSAGRLLWCYGDPP